MSFSINKVTLVGNITQTPELKYTSNGNPIEISNALNQTLKPVKSAVAVNTNNENPKPQVAKSKKLLDENVYKVHHQEKFSTMEEADDFITEFSAVCDRNRRAVYLGVE